MLIMDESERLVAAANCEGLTPRQRDVLQAIYDGVGSIKAIGAHLGISPCTVKVYIANLSARFGTTDRATLARYWNGTLAVHRYHKPVSAPNPSNVSYALMARRSKDFSLLGK